MNRAERHAPALCAAALAASFIFHLVADPFAEPAAQAAGAAVIWICFGACVLLACALPRGARAQPRARVEAGAALLAALPFAPFLISSPVWSEELSWINSAKGILEGSLVYPIGGRGDFPSGFQSWPVAAFLALCGDTILANRLPCLLYNVGSALFTGRLAGLIAGRSSALHYLIPALLFAPAAHAHLGWNQIAMTPFLFAAQLYLYRASLDEPTLRRAAWLALFCALGVWSLYTPAISGAVLAGLFLLARRGRPESRIFTLILALLLVPLAAAVLRHPESLVHRHLDSYLGGAARDTWNLRLLPGAWRSGGAALLSALSPGALVSQWDSVVLRSDWLTFSLAAIGSLLALVRLRARPANAGVLLLLGLFALLLVSDPGFVNSPWRALPMSVFTGAFAGAGASALIALGARLAGRAGSAVPLCLALAQLALFAPRYQALLNMPEVLSSEQGEVGRRIYARFAQDLGVGRELGLVGFHGWLAGYVAAYTPTRPELRYLASEEEVRAAVANGAVALVSLDEPSTEIDSRELAELLSRMGCRFEESELEPVKRPDLPDLRARAFLPADRQPAACSWPDPSAKPG